MQLLYLLVVAAAASIMAKCRALNWKLGIYSLPLMMIISFAAYQTECAKCVTLAGRERDCRTSETCHDGCVMISGSVGNERVRVGVLRGCDFSVKSGET